MAEAGEHDSHGRNTTTLCFPGKPATLDCSHLRYSGGLCRTRTDIARLSDARGRCRLGFTQAPRLPLFTCQQPHRLVLPLRIELRMSGYKADVIPLNYRSVFIVFHSNCCLFSTMILMFACSRTSCIFSKSENPNLGLIFSIKKSFLGSRYTS